MGAPARPGPLVPAWDPGPQQPLCAIRTTWASHPNFGNGFLEISREARFSRQPETADPKNSSRSSSPMTKKRVAIFASGSGSNLQALLDAMQAPDFPAEPVLVFSDK